MKFDSPHFDRIRVKPDPESRARENRPGCDWKGCTEAATHRAPKGRLREREYWCFCLEHVREYNHAYNFFAGMSMDDIARYQKDAVIGHRPTWKMGMNGGRPSSPSHSSRSGAHFSGPDDPFGLFRDFDAGAQTRSSPRHARPVRNAERKALDALGLEPQASSQQVKRRLK